MEIICSMGGIVDVTHPRQGIADLKNAGFDKVLLDFSMFCWLDRLWPEEERAAKTKPFPEAKLRQCYETLLDGLKAQGLKTSLGVVPYPGWETKRRDWKDLMLRVGKDSIRAWEAAGSGGIIIRPLSAGIDPGKEWEENRSYYLELANACRKPETKLLIQNFCRNVNGRLSRGICSDGQEAAKWVEQLNVETGDDRFGFCMDTGFLSLCGQDMREIAVALGRHLKAVILRENDGRHNFSMLPFTGVPGADWLGMLRGLRAAGFDGGLVMDFSSTAGGFSPILRPQLLQLAKAVAEYFRWQIEIEAALKKYRSIVLFGAGNMCRNFMKCYGETYPPLFTCDNDSSLWGSSFCGLLVRPPEALQKLPKDCGIFICNIYYREIEQQLKEMGVGNIEFFNDEYMPSFHFDRLERG